MIIKKLTAAVLCVLMLVVNVFAEEMMIDVGSVFSETTVTQSEQDESENQTQENKTYFSDVPVDSQYAQAITKMVESGIIEGYGDNTFRPENGVTRAEMCKMINLTFNYTNYDNATGFPDVTEDLWYAPYVLAAKEAGYIEGYEDGTFRGNNNITRQEVCTIICRIIKPMDLGINVKINDEVSDWAKKNVELIVMNMLMPLEENNTFRAKENIKRYELASLLSLFVVPPAEPLTAEVRFFNGEAQIGETDTVLIGDYPTVPEEPTHKDISYEFAGWRVVGQSELCDAESMMIISNTDFEAVFKKKTFKVEFFDGGTLYSTDTVEYGNSPVEPENAPETPGYDFLGWSLQEGGQPVYVKDLVIVSDTQLYAVFAKSEIPGGGNGDSGDDSEDESVYYEVYFFLNEEIYDTQSVLKGSNPKKPLDPELDGSIFLGWSLKEEGDEDDIVDVTRYVVKDYTDFYAVVKRNPNDANLISMLEKGISQLSSIRFTKNIHKTARTEIVNCMKLVLADAKSGIYVDQEYISTTYEAEVAYVETLVLDEMSGREASEFKTYVTNNVDEDVQDFLQEYFLNGEEIEV